MASKHKTFNFKAISSNVLQMTSRVLSLANFNNVNFLERDGFHKDRMQKMKFFQQRRNFPELFVEGSDHKCCILHTRFYQFISGKSVIVLKLTVILEHYLPS